MSEVGSSRDDNERRQTVGTWRRRLFQTASGRSAIRLEFAAVLAGVMVLAALPSGSRAFSSDRSLWITSPAPLSVVTPPFQVTWTARPAPGHQYALFVDSPPIEPGSNLRQLSLQSCKRVPTCQPSAGYLAGIGVYITATDQVTVQTLQPLGGLGQGERYQVHQVTIVETDSSGRRVGSAAWEMEFRA
jgi:hypothetical protein